MKLAVCFIFLFALVGFLSANHDDCRWVLEMGCTFCAVGSDLAMLTNTSKAVCADFKEFIARLE